MTEDDALLDRSLFDPLPESPLPTLARWFEDARKAPSVRNHDAMVLATVDAEARPSVRMVLCRAIDFERARFAFYTDRTSPKARQLETSGRASAVFHWDPLARQVRISGPVKRASDADSDDYFARRSPASQLAAWTSRQSRPISSRAELEERFAKVEERFQGGPVPRPADWGGYVITAETIELWVSREGRLHDRALWTYEPTRGTWRVARLQP
jgi:pyridoxamine 5'-phosphate oxidase